VAFAGSHGEYGLTVILDHGEDLRTIYGHLSKIAVAQGEKIARGDQLGLTGNTGRSSGPHLHYEILVKNSPVNPRAYFWD
jgi:murein DD-endopeptidase MepM/ murein hydrolase activator NlpD